VLLDTSAGPENAESLPLYEQLAVAMRDGEDELRSGAVDAAQQVLYGASWREGQPGGAGRGEGEDARPPRDGGYLAARAVFDRDDVLGEVGAIAAPTLVLCGEEDIATPVEHSRRAGRGDRRRAPGDGPGRRPPLADREPTGGDEGAGAVLAELPDSLRGRVGRPSQPASLAARSS